MATKGAPASGKIPIEVASLLSIDVESELRTLTSGLLQGVWQLPAELVRWALFRGAGEVAVRLEDGGLRVNDDGGGAARSVLEELAALLDRSRAPILRHRAVIALEEVGAVALVALSGLELLELRIDSWTPEGWHRLELGRGSGTSLRSESTSGKRRGVSILLRTRSLESRQSRQWLRRACGFSAARILLDGSPVPCGFRPAVLTRALEPPLHGRISIPMEGGVARIWLLEHGVVTAHVTAPEPICFEAALEINDSATAGSEPGTTRRLAEQHLEALARQAERFLVDRLQSERRPEIGAPARARRLLLRQARVKGVSGELGSVPLVRMLGRIEGSLREWWTNLREVERLVVVEEKGQRVLEVLDPDQPRERYDLLGGPVLLLDPEERSLLADVLQVAFRPPRLSQAAEPFCKRVRGHLRRTGRQLGQALLSLFRRYPLPEEALTPEERSLVEALRLHLGDVYPGVIAVCQGRGPIRRARSGERGLLMPRDNPDVRLCALAIQRARAWVYPASFLLLKGQASPRSRARQAWRQLILREPRA